MRFIFYYSSDEEKKELKNLLDKIGTNHFGEVSYSYAVTPFERPLESHNFASVQVAWELYVSDALFIEDLNKAKDSVYEQNKNNMWHNIQKNPTDLPVLYTDILTKDDKGKVSINSFKKGLSSQPDYWTCNNVTEWTYFDADEIILTDFLSDLEENCSYALNYELMF